MNTTVVARTIPVQSSKGFESTVQPWSVAARVKYEAYKSPSSGFKSRRRRPQWCSAGAMARGGIRP